MSLLVVGVSWWLYGGLYSLLVGAWLCWYVHSLSKGQP